MATYVFSDVHGHRATLERVMERVSPTEDDTFFCLGDMIDRGPDPVGVVRVVRGLPHVQVLMGNHEDLMISFFADPDDPLNQLNWFQNGGMRTVSGMRDMPDGEAQELVDWVCGLARWTQVVVGERRYVLVHAGIMPHRGAPLGEMGEKDVEDLMAAQDPEDLAWIRDQFWSRRTGLVDDEGRGPIVIAGHTPSPYLRDYPTDRPVMGDDGRAQIVRVGHPEETGGVYDRWDIDSGAAGGAGFGRVTVLRLDDGEEFAEPVLEGE